MIDVAAEHEDLDRDPDDAPVDYVDVVQVANITVYEGTGHPLATIDRSTIKAFSRLKQSGEESGLDEETNAERHGKRSEGG